MKSKATYETPFRRRREGKTSYKKRLAAVKSGVPRMCVRKSNRYIIAQLIEFNPTGDKILVHATSKQLDGFGWNGEKNLPSAYLTGMLLAARAKKANVEKAILDIGFNTPVHGSRVFAALAANGMLVLSVICINLTDKIGGKSTGALIINGKLKAVKTIIVK